MKKKIVLGVLFILPVVVYLFFASGVNNFGRLPVLSENVSNVSTLDPNLQFKDKITILGFLGNKELYCTPHLDYTVQTSKNFGKNQPFFGFHVNHEPIIHVKPKKLYPDLGVFFRTPLPKQMAKKMVPHKS